MTIDERIQELVRSTEFLKESTESLHSQMSETFAEFRRRDEESRRMDERQRQLDRKQRKLLGALADAAIHFLDQLREDDDEKKEDKT